MANRVLSIKMDDKDIDKIKKYYEALINAGYLSSKTMSLNAFYKHLLLDYLEDDLVAAFSTYSEYGITPRCIDPNRLDCKEGIHLSNTYDLTPQAFETYKKCIQEQLRTKLKHMHNNAERFNEILKGDIIVDKGTFNELRYFPHAEEPENTTSFWQNKAFETIDALNSDNSRTTNQSEVAEEIEMIKNSSVSEDEKEQLISEILTYAEKLQHNRAIIQGARFIR